jgi:hypothetical protein
MKLPLLFSVCIFSMCSIHAYADIYKRVDADGRITYSNAKSPGATRLEIGPEESAKPTAPTKASQANAPSKRASTPESFPNVDQKTQNARDDKRREILQLELEAEKDALAQAQKAYADGEASPEIYHKKNANGTVSTFRNMPKFDEKMQALRADVESHQKNIELLQKELNALH